MRDWWNSIVAEIDLEPHRLRVLEAACGAWDRMVEARQAVAEHGLTFTSKDGDPRPRPEVAIERDARIAFARLVRDLGLDTPIPQPPNEIGWRPPARKPWA
jgi:P27 family predicted phage terminase small subunit